MPDTDAPVNTVLFVHHGQVNAAGAPVSLRLALKASEPLRRFEPIIAAHDANAGLFISGFCGVRQVFWPNPQTFVGKVIIRLSGLDSSESILMFFRQCLRFPMSVLAQRGHFRELKPDAVHLNSSVLFSTALAAWLRRIPIVWHVRETIAGRWFRLRRIFCRYVIPLLATRVICISPTEAKRFTNRFGNIRVVYNPVDFSRLDPDRLSREEARSRLGLPQDARIVISLGGCASRKGTDLLIQALQYCDEKTVLVFLGPPLPSGDGEACIRWYHRVEDWLVRKGLKSLRNWDYAERVHALYKAYDAGRIRFPGGVEDVSPYLAACDVLAFIGMTPHFARPIFEAWAMKKPVCVLEMEGISTCVDDGGDGVVVKSPLPEAIGGALRTLLADGALRKRMGENGYQKSHACMDPSTSAAGLVAAIHDALGLPACDKENS